MEKQTFISTTGNGVARAESMLDGTWQVERLLEDAAVTYLINDPVNPDIVYAGSRKQGVLRSDDRGQSWQSIGLSGQIVKSIAICRAEPDVMYAGTKPPAVFVTRDGGRQWTELKAFRQLRRWFWFTPAEAGDPYVMGLAVSPDNPDLVVAGIEFGGMFRSTDGGETWQGHLKSTSRDCHNLKFHDTDGKWIYQAAGGWPAAVSSDSGSTWSQPRKGLGWSLYGMACAADPQQPNIWYLSAAPHAVLPAIHKMPRGHQDGEANAFIFRMMDNGCWKRLEGGLPQPLNHMAYALITDPDAPGHLYAGLSNGDIWFTTDYGETWQQLPVNLSAIRYSLVRLT